jgi:tRNA uridine 5-carbamoylmethylation protein Kti12
MKSDAERCSLSVRLPSETIKRIEKSGEVPSGWLRQAVRLRLEREQQARNTLNTVDARMNRLEQEMTQLRKEIMKLQQSEAITQATQSDMRKTLTQIQRNQATFHEMLARLDQSFGESLEQLGQALLNALSQQLRERVKVQEEPPRRIIPPAPPRTRL